MSNIQRVLDDYQKSAIRALEDNNLLSANAYCYCYNLLSIELGCDRMLYLYHDKLNKSWRIYNLHRSEYYSRVAND